MADDIDPGEAARRRYLGLLRRGGVDRPIRPNLPGAFNAPVEVRVLPEGDPLAGSGGRMGGGGGRPPAPPGFGGRGLPPPGGPGGGGPGGTLRATGGLPEVPGQEYVGRVPPNSGRVFGTGVPIRALRPLGRMMGYPAGLILDSTPANLGEAEDLAMALQQRDLEMREGETARSQGAPRQRPPARGNASRAAPRPSRSRSRSASASRSSSRRGSEMSADDLNAVSLRSVRNQEEPSAATRSARENIDRRRRELEKDTPRMSKGGSVPRKMAVGGAVSNPAIAAGRNQIANNRNQVQGIKDQVAGMQPGQQSAALRGQAQALRGQNQAIRGAVQSQRAMMRQGRAPGPNGLVGAAMGQPRGLGSAFGSPVGLGAAGDQIGQGLAATASRQRQMARGGAVAKYAKGGAVPPKPPKAPKPPSPAKPPRVPNPSLKGPRAPKGVQPPKSR